MKLCCVRWEEEKLAYPEDKEGVLLLHHSMRVSHAQTQRKVRAVPKRKLIRCLFE